MKILSHPDKELLTHLTNVKKIGIATLNSKKINFKIPINEIIAVLETILFYHDFGKSTKFFQDYLQSKIKESDYTNSLELTHHSLISACITGYKLKENLINSNYQNLLSLLGFLAVRKHHGNLENFEDMVVISNKEWKILENQWENFLYPFDSEIKDYSFEDIKDFISEFLWIEPDEDLENFILLNFLFSLLTYSDKVDVIFGKINKIKLPENIINFISNYKKNKFKNIKPSDLNQIREEAYNISLEKLKDTYDKHNIFSLNLPTGAGKTLTVLNNAFYLLNKDNSLKRIIYALPFTSIIDQLELILKDILRVNNLNPDDYLITHHHLAEIKIKEDENYFDGDKAQFLIENWDKPIILTTFWQLFNSIITNKNSQLRKFHNIANSVIILDEVQSIPYKYWNLTNKIFKTLTEIFNCKIIFLTATMPLIFREDKKEIIPLIPEEKKNEYYKKFSRYRVELLNHLNGIKIDELFEKAKNDINNHHDKSFLFEFNTIKSSINFFNLLKEETDKEIIYLSTNILPVERKKRINKIKENPKDKIIISTQLIEAGIDIDIDIVYRDFAPLDSIIQTAGRCNRNNKSEYKGRVVLFKLINENGKCDYQYIYKGLSLSATTEILKIKNCYDESELLNLINSYFIKIKNNASGDPSKIILDKIKKLQYEDVVDEFKLIDEIPEFLIFIEYDKKAIEILNKFQEIISIEDRFNRKNEFLKIKSSFYQYVLSVKLDKNTKNYYQNLEEIGNLKIVNKEFVSSIYDKNTGLIREWSCFI